MGLSARLYIVYEEAGGQAYKPVVQLFRNTTDEWYHIHANGEEIICTGEHPFYVASREKFITARELKVGETLLLSDDSCVIIEGIKVERLKKPETTYNFEVADYHTYYVSESQVLVHNKCFDPTKNADYSVKYDAEGRTFKAYHQADGSYKDLFVAKDGYRHGGSKFKLLKEVSGSKLELIGDLNSEGVLMTAKHSSNVGIRYSYYGKTFL